MNRKLAIALVCFALSALVFASLCQAEVGADKVMHFAISGAAGFAASAVITDATDLSRWARRGLAFSAAMAPGVYKEFAVDAKADHADMMANITGAAFGVWLGEYLAAPSRSMTRTEDLREIVGQ